MKNFVAQRLDLDFQLDEVSYRYDDVPAVFSGRTQLSGPLNNLLVTGDLDLQRMRYSRDIDLEAMLKDFKRRPLEARGFEKKDEWLRYDLNVRVDPDARIDNNLMRAGLAGKVTVVGTNAHMGLLGALTFQEGARASFRGNEFAITRATVELTERERIAPVIDLHAETAVRDYKVFVHAWGPFEDPQVELTSEPQLARADVVMLLTLGLTSKDAGSYGTAGAGYGFMSEALLNLSGLDKAAKRFLRENPVVRSLDFHIATQYSQATMAVEPTAQFESRVFTDALKLRYTQPMISPRGRKAQLEYLLNENISLQTQWEESSDTPLGSDLGFDLKLQWESD
jgi:translocation and assembly module TamB